MPTHLASVRRGAPPAPPAPTAPSAGVYVTAQQLAALEEQARHLVLRPRRPGHNILAGRHASRLRGRGLDFEDLRQYMPGDDVRTIDWRVTARTRKPFVRVYTEEKDRPAFLVVDQRINMFFGSKVAMKSVVAAQAAALCAWRILMDGDRLGGVVFDDERIDEQRLERDRGSVLRMLGRIVERNQALRADAAITRHPSQLDAALDSVSRVVTHDHAVIVISDCDGFTDRTRDLLRRLAMRNDVILLFVYDPMLVGLPVSGDLVVSNGELQVEVRMGSGRTRRAVADAADRRWHSILNLRREIGVTVAPISTAEDTAAQLRRLIGSPSGTPRGAR